MQVFGIDCMVDEVVVSAPIEGYVKEIARILREKCGTECTVKGPHRARSQGDV